MKRIWTIFLLASAAPGADVTLWTSGRTLVDNSVRYSAMEQVVRMFKTIGIGVEWKNASVDEHVSIEVRFATGVAGHPGAWAFSTPFDPQPAVNVMYDRIIADTATQQTLRAPVLAHVLIHEISHVLMRLNSHAPEGVMKAHWTSSDYGRMAHQPLAFLPSDADLIRRGLKFLAAKRAEAVRSSAAAEADRSDNGHAAAGQGGGAVKIVVK